MNVNASLRLGRALAHRARSPIPLDGIEHAGRLPDSLRTSIPASGAQTPDTYAIEAIDKPLIVISQI